MDEEGLWRLFFETGLSQVYLAIAGERAGRQIRLFVDDDGPGVPEAALPKLFDAFYRNDPPGKIPTRAAARRRAAHDDPHSTCREGLAP